MVHIAGFPVQTGTKYRQRCAWCDHVLLDGDTANEFSDTGANPAPRFWEVGAFVASEGHGSWVVGGALPVQTCASYPAWVTQ